MAACASVLHPTSRHGVIDVDADVHAAPRAVLRTERALPSRQDVDAKIEIARWRAVVVAAVAISSLFLGLSALIGAPGGEPLAAPGRAAPPVRLGAGSTYVVQPGDTLWSIARRLAPASDPRPVVDELTAATGASTLQPGQRITLPAR